MAEVSKVDGDGVAATPTGRRAIIWCEAEHADLIDEWRQATRLDLAAIGAPNPAAAAELSTRFQAEKTDDLRQAVHHVSHDVLVLLTLGGIVRDERKTIFDKASATLTLEPIADGISDASLEGVKSPVWLVPAMRHSAPMRLFDDLRENLGAIRSVNVMMRCRGSRGSLYARLTDAVDTVERLCGPIELLDAAMSGPTSNQPETLRELHGHITVNARFAQNCCASIHVSDCGGTWARGVTVLAENGCVRMTDHDLEWVDPAGAVMEQNRFERPSARGAAAAPADLLADEIDAILDPRRVPREPYPQPSTLAVCEAVRLSIRTGQGESPRKLQQLIRA
ncbi:MAG: hypothetical protein IT430_17605 [Phycisphaerales bacterium]|nr:hypothetical protein [Phycisphaerales bacterium]